MKKYLPVIPLILLFCLTIACYDKAAMAELDKARTQTQLEEQNKAVVRQVFEAIDAKDYARVKELLAPDFIGHNPQENFNRDAVLQMVSAFYAAFPDGIHKFEDILADGNKVVARAVWEGTQKAEFQGMPPTGNKVSFWSISISTVVDGKLKELWGMDDNLTMMTQLGMELKPSQEKKK